MTLWGADVNVSAASSQGDGSVLPETIVALNHLGFSAPCLLGIESSIHLSDPPMHQHIK